ncbi:hypothetical protein ACWKSP_28005 [Micromonosporaceae bacterium Da 78-11]
MRWFRRPADEPPPPPRPGDDPAALHRALDDLDRYVNRSAGRLPGWAVVEARWITDTLRAVVDTSGLRPLEVTTVLLVTGMTGDYLPTTISHFVAVDDTLHDQPRRNGRTPSEHLRDQLADLRGSVTAALAAARDQDIDALVTQGSFLRTKFSRSDLDL